MIYKVSVTFHKDFIEVNNDEISVGIKSKPQKGEANKELIKKLAEDSTSGLWVAGADFAVVVLTDPKLGFHLIDTGRVVQQMQLSAWNSGVISGVYTGIKEEAMRNDFGFPADVKPTMVVGFGYPVKKIVGKKNRMPISELAFVEKFGNKFDPKKLS